MKKVFTLALIMLVATAGYSQVKKASIKDSAKAVAESFFVDGSETYEFVGNTPNMLRENGELDQSTYDWQTNTAAKNWAMTFPDGKVGFSFTIATDEAYTDRGTDIIIYDPETDEWSTVGGKIENIKTGFGCAARFGENGIVVVSREAVSLNEGVYIIEDKDNLPEPGTVAPIKTWVKDDRNLHFPTVTCTGPNHDHIHILFTALNWTDDDGLTNPFFYFRSMDGGVTWDEFMTIDYLGREYSSNYGSGQDAYFIENNGEDELRIVLNNRRSDGAVLTSTDEGNTWTRTEFYHHPGIDLDFGDSTICLYPRWTSALYDNDGTLHIAYEINAQKGDPTSTNYYPGIGGVAYWSSVMPYRGEDGPQFGADPNNPMPPTYGQPFIMDSAYLYEDIYGSWWLWSDAPHDMWPEFIGYLTPLDEDGQPLLDPYEATEFNMYISGSGLVDHGAYNCGPSAMPTLLMTPDESLMVAVWISMDDNNINDEPVYSYFKIFTRASRDKGETWTPMIQLTNDFEFSYTEFSYPVANITGNKLVILAQTDGDPDSYVIGGGTSNNDTDQMDNFFYGMAFDLDELFPITGVEEITTVKTKMSIYPNPAVDVLNVTLNQDDNVVIYSLTGQAITSFQGHAGLNNYNVSDLSSGVYFISAGTVTHKFVVK